MALNEDKKSMRLSFAFRKNVYMPNPENDQQQIHINNKRR